MADLLDALENQSIFILREAYFKFKNLALLWSIGKDSTVLLWLLRKAFFGKYPVPIVHIDTSYKIPEMIKYRDQMAKEWGIKIIVGRNKGALDSGMGPDGGKLKCCTALKTDALKYTMRQKGFTALILGIRRDEESTRAKERFFSPRDENFEWDYKDQPPELWDYFMTDFPQGTHIRIHPLLNWTEINVWEYIKKENIPIIDLYFARKNKRYRSLGCSPCTMPIKSKAQTIDQIIEELKNACASERAGRSQDREHKFAMQKLRAKGYM